LNLYLLLLIKTFLYFLIFDFGGKVKKNNSFFQIFFHLIIVLFLTCIIHKGSKKIQSVMFEKKYFPEFLFFWEKI